MKKNEWTNEHCAVVDELLELKNQLPHRTETEFHQRYIAPYMSYTVYTRMRDKVYTGKIDKHAALLKKAIAAIKDMLATRKMPCLDDSDEFHNLPVFDALFNAVSIAHHRNDECRLVIYLAKTGGGKSELIRQVVSRYNGVFCEADRTWGKSYASPACDICRALGMPGPWKSARSARTALISSMQESKTRGLLGIDEGNTFGKEACDLVKAILNQTMWTVVITAIPVFFDRMLLNSWDEAKQLLNRAVAVVREEDLDISSVIKFTEYVGVNVDRTGAEIIARAANTFGGFRMVKSIRDELATDFPDGEMIPVDAVQHTTKACLRLKGFHMLDGLTNQKKGRAA